MSAMASTAGFSTTNASTATFYGYSAESTIVVSGDKFPTYITNSTNWKDAYKNYPITGRVSGDIITLNLSTSCTYDYGYGSTLVARVYKRENGGSWVQIQSYSGPGTSTETITGVDYNDTIDLRVYVKLTAPYAVANAACHVTVTGGTFTSGTGTISVGSYPSIDLSVSG
jgi:hypothetical protein